MDDRFEFRTDLDVSLVRSSASDNDVIFAARVSTLGERAASSNTDGDARLISYLMRERHGSPFEHNSMTFFVRAPIFVFRELMRHRIASYNEESARYRQLSPIFYIPSRRRPLVQTGKPGHYQFVEGTPEQV